MDDENNDNCKIRYWTRAPGSESSTSDLGINCKRKPAFSL